MKLGFLIFTVLLLIIVIVLLAVVVFNFMIRLNNTTRMCCECAYYKRGKCKHWDEKRTPDMGICEAFKEEKK